MHYRTDRRTGDKINCDYCNSRCPFSVDQMGRMREIKEYFAKGVAGDDRNH